MPQPAASPPSAALPWPLLLAACLAIVFLAAPVVAMLLRIPPAQLMPTLTSESSLAALRVSLLTAIPATLLCLLLGVPLGVWLARRPSLRWLRTLVLLPLVLPPVVSGIALVSAFGRFGLIGRHLSAWGIEIAFTSVAVILAQTFVALPFLVLTVDGAVRALGDSYERTAATLGARRWFTFRRVTVPLIRPALVAGTILVFARALGEFGATITFAGSLQGTTRTLPLEIYLQRELNPEAAVTLSVLLLLLACVIIALTYSRTRHV